MFQDETLRMWQLPFPPSVVKSLPNAVIAPLGMALQDTINESGKIVPKWRITHDQSFDVDPGASRSVNKRVIDEGLTPCQFGRALIRYIHYILHLRRRHPNRHILQTKVDLKAAYRRLHHSAHSACHSLVFLDDLILASLRLTFGGSPNPSMWSDVSETMFDTANDLVRNEGWDPEVHASPHQHLIGDKIDCLPDDVPFAASLPVIVQHPDDTAPKCDGYIDDAFMAFLIDDIQRGGSVLPFVVALFGRPVHVLEAQFRDDMLSLKKFLAEATPSELKMILGWRIDTRRLLISLPEDKFVAWSSAIQGLLAADFVTTAALDTTVGRLNHTGSIIPLARHFLSCIRTALHRSRHHRQCHLRPAERLDLELWLKFLAKAHDGISLNLISFREPTRIMRQDACEHGIGGYSLTSGFGWQWEIPLDLQGRATLNTLEFLASYVSIYMEIHESPVTANDILLSQGDSTSATGWIRKSNFDEEVQPLQLLIARALATLILDHNIGLYSQWFPGDENDVGDSLSRDHHLSADAIVLMLSSAVPEQVPPGFGIKVLPPALVSQLTLWLRSLPRVKPPQTQPLRSKHGTGRTTSNILTTLRSRPTPSSRILTHMNDAASCPPLPLPTDTAPSPTKPTSDPHLQALQLYLEQSVPPLMQWLRPTGLTTIAAPSTMPPVGNSSTPFNDSCEATPTKIQPQNPRRPYHARSSGK